MTVVVGEGLLSRSSNGADETIPFVAGARLILAIVAMRYVGRIDD